MTGSDRPGGCNRGMIRDPDHAEIAQNGNGWNTCTAKTALHVNATTLVRAGLPGITAFVSSLVMLLLHVMCGALTGQQVTVPRLQGRDTDSKYQKQYDNFHH